jgi:uncharacterized membrane protein
MNKSKSQDVYMPTKRLETLVDGIFAIAMTLLVLGLTVPHINVPLSNTVIQESYYTLIPNLFSFVLSFILLAAFWNRHHRMFNQIKMIDSNLLWINIIWLLFIVMVPFSASSIGQYGDYTLPCALFNLNMLLIGLFLYLNMNYAIKKNFMNEEANTTLIKKSKRNNEVFIIIALIAIILSFQITSNSTLTYILLIPLQLAINRFTN